jgi:predicted transcriptional regulator
VESPSRRAGWSTRLRVRTSGGATIKTLLLRAAAQKGCQAAIAGKIVLYSAAIGPPRTNTSIRQPLVIDRVFDGFAGNFLDLLVRNEAFRPGELDELRRLLEEKTRAGAGGE